MNHSPSLLSRHRGALLATAKAAVGLGLLALLLAQIGWVEIKALLGRANLGQLTIACGWLALALAAQAWRWMAVMGGLDAPITPRTAFVGTFESMLFNQLLPSSVGGDAWRALRAYDAGLAAEGAVVGVLIDRAFGLIAVALVIVLAWAIGGATVTATAVFPLIAFAAACIVGGAGVAAIAGTDFKRESLPAGARWIVALLHAFATIARRRAPLAHIVAAMALFTLLSSLAFQACGKALGLHIDLWTAMIVLQGLLLASVIPISIGGWGLREGAAVLLFAGTGIAAAEATAVSILFGLTATVMGVLGGVVWMLNGYQRVAPADGFAALRPGPRD